MNYDRDRAMREQEAAEAMIQMREPCKALKCKVQRMDICDCLNCRDGWPSHCIGNR